MKRLKIGVLASGGGSNLQSIIDGTLDGTINGEVVLVISNNSNAKALERAENHGIKWLHISSITEESQEDANQRILAEMRAHDIDLIVLAGYMKSIGSELVDAFEHKIINIHPALLPKFGGKGMYGMNVHRAVVAAKETESGPTVHYVDSKYDTGEIIAQSKVPVYPDDTPEDVQERVLIEEHKLFPEIIRKLAEEWEN